MLALAFLLRALPRRPGSSPYGWPIPSESARSISTTSWWLGEVNWPYLPHVGHPVWTEVVAFSGIVLCRWVGILVSRDYAPSPPMNSHLAELRQRSCQ